MAKRKVEIFSAGCGVCDETLKLVKSIACSSCDVTVLSMNDASVSKRARDLGIRSMPAVLDCGELTVVLR